MQVFNVLLVSAANATKPLRGSNRNALPVSPSDYGCARDTSIGAYLILYDEKHLKSQVQFRSEQVPLRQTKGREGPEDCLSVAPQNWPRPTRW